MELPHQILANGHYFEEFAWLCSMNICSVLLECIPFRESAINMQIYYAHQNNTHGLI
jgi:hypothetical protein